MNADMNAAEFTQLLTKVNESVRVGKLQNKDHTYIGRNWGITSVKNERVSLETISQQMETILERPPVSKAELINLKIAYSNFTRETSSKVWGITKFFNNLIYGTFDRINAQLSRLDTLISEASEAEIYPNRNAALNGLNSMRVNESREGNQMPAHITGEHVFYKDGNTFKMLVKTGPNADDFIEPNKQFETKGDVDKFLRPSFKPQSQSYGKFSNPELKNWIESLKLKNFKNSREDAIRNNQGYSLYFEDGPRPGIVILTRGEGQQRVNESRYPFEVGQKLGPERDDGYAPLGEEYVNADLPQLLLGLESARKQLRLQ